MTTMFNVYHTLARGGSRFTVLAADGLRPTSADDAQCAIDAYCAAMAKQTLAEASQQKSPH